MTKKLLLSAAAAATALFAGSASAGEFLLSSEFGGTYVGGAAPGVLLSNGGVAGTTLAWVPYAVASEKTVSSTAKLAGQFQLDYKLTNTVTVPDGGSATYTIFLTGANATFINPSQAVATARFGVALGTAVVPGGAGTIVVTTHVNTAGQLVAVVSVAAAGANITFDGFRIQGQLESSSNTDITIAGETWVASGGASNLKIDEAGARTLVDYVQVITGLTAVANNGLAKLNDYKQFGAIGSAVLAGKSTTWNILTGVGLAVAPTASTVTTLPLYAGNAFHSDFVATPVTAAAILDTSVATVASTAAGQVSHLVRSFAGASQATGATAASATFNVNATNSDALLVAGTRPNVVLNNGGTSPAPVELQEAAYSVSIRPTYATGYTSPTTAFTNSASGTIAHEGVNFNAPWVALNASTPGLARLRIANTSATVPTGPAWLTLRSQAHGSTPATTARIPLTNSLLVAGQLTAQGGIPAGEFITIDGSKLGAAFGTDSSNGDVRVTINGDSTNLSAKLRVTAGGQTFESSLHNGL